MMEKAHQFAGSIGDEVLVVLEPEGRVPPLVHVEHEVIQRASCTVLAVGVRAFQHGACLGFPPSLLLPFR